MCVTITSESAHHYHQRALSPFPNETTFPITLSLDSSSLMAYTCVSLVLLRSLYLRLEENEETKVYFAFFMLLVRPNL